MQFCPAYPWGINSTADKKMLDGTFHMEYSLPQKDVAKAMDTMSPRFECLCSIKYVQTVEVLGTGISKEFCMFWPKFE